MIVLLSSEKMTSKLPESVLITWIALFSCLKFTTNFMVYCLATWTKLAAKMYQGCSLEGRLIVPAY